MAAGFKIFNILFIFGALINSDVNIHCFFVGFKPGFCKFYYSKIVKYFDKPLLVLSCSNFFLLYPTHFLIIRKGKNTRLGYFDNLDDARSARVIAERQYGYHENHGGTS